MKQDGWIDYYKEYRYYETLTNKHNELSIQLENIQKENQMLKHEYTPIHIHQGMLLTGLSSVMILKLPELLDNNQNGKLQILGAANGQFAKIDYQPKLKERDFYVFPYDMRHGVYPFNGSGIRRSLSANMDVEYDPIKNR